MLGRLWADHRWACLLSLALLVVGAVVSPWVLLAAVVPIGWVVLNKKTAKDDQSLAITEEAEAMSELPKDWEELVNSVYYDEDAMQKLEEIEVEQSVLNYFSQSDDIYIRCAIALHKDSSKEIINRLSKDQNEKVKSCALFYRKLKKEWRFVNENSLHHHIRSKDFAEPETLQILSKSFDSLVRIYIAQREDTPDFIIEVLRHDENQLVKQTVRERDLPKDWKIDKDDQIKKLQVEDNIEEKILDILSTTDDLEIRNAVALCDSTPNWILKRLKDHESDFYATAAEECIRARKLPKNWRYLEENEKINKLVEEDVDNNILEIFSHSNYYRIREAVGLSTNLSEDIINKLKDDEVAEVRYAAKLKRNLPIQWRLLQDCDIERKLKISNKQGKEIDDSILEILAQSKNYNIKEEVAKSQSTNKKTLEYLCNVSNFESINSIAREALTVRNEQSNGEQILFNKIQGKLNIKIKGCEICFYQFFQARKECTNSIFPEKMLNLVKLFIETRCVSITEFLNNEKGSLKYNEMVKNLIEEEYGSEIESDEEYPDILKEIQEFVSNILEPLCVAGIDLKIDSSRIEDLLLDPKLRLWEIEKQSCNPPDLSSFPEEYMDEASCPKATKIKVSNLVEKEEEDKFTFDIKYEFDDFIIYEPNAGLKELNLATSSGEVSIASLLGLNLDLDDKFSIGHNIEPQIQIEFEATNIKPIPSNNIKEIFAWGLTKGSGYDALDGCIFAQGILFISGEDADKKSKFICYEKTLGEGDIVLAYSSEACEDLNTSLAKALANSKDKELLKIDNNVIQLLILTAIIRDSSILRANLNLFKNYIFEYSDSATFCEVLGDPFNDDDEKLLIGAYCRSADYKQSASLLDINDSEKLLELATKLLEDPCSIECLEAQVLWHGVHLVPSE